MNSIKLFNETSGETWYIANDKITVQTAEKLTELLLDVLRRDGILFSVFCTLHDLILLDSAFCAVFSNSICDRGTEIPVNVVYACSARF